jgi:hypothetical protein
VGRVVRVVSKVLEITLYVILAAIAIGTLVSWVMGEPGAPAPWDWI